MKLRLFLPLITFAGMLLLSLPALSFGPNGHRIVARIAEDHLSPEAKAAIFKITEGRHLAQSATWPDEIRSDSGWDFAKPWHFVSIDDDESFDDYEHSDKGDILIALQKFESILAEKKVNQTEMWRALAFYIHFVGDIHQPLHVGRRDDYGGNKVRVKWFGRKTNLHSVWDSSLIENEQLSFREYASFLDNVTSSQIREWQSSTYRDWATESKSVRKQVYDLGNSSSEDPSLSYEYAYKNKALIDDCLVKDGIRLAGKLNSLFE
ncbi:S1/P1 nuclease [Hahella ganghwensis]|uniref:S1/P1 nuclease n=1 Tax=Hahella ganghwensis TaxID=286420 RepID=UPI00035EF5B8|nr:S1/P1 nuclease [Hahella ganghwensis]